MAPVRLPPASSVLATLTVASNTLAVERLAPGGEPAGAELGIDHYKILRTDEVDAKDVPLTAAERASVIATTAAAIRNPGDDFMGTARKVAKLSISDAQAETVDTVAAVVATLPPKSAMIDHHPEITDEADSGRVDEEERNVRVTAFLYAASREADNDFHLIVGNPQGQEEVYMTMEISGLPPSDAASHAQLRSARDSFNGFFGDKTPGTSYDFYDPPIPIRVAGSLFFDMSHAHGRSPGPPTLHPHMPVIWEVHPISSIEFEPGPAG
jgi:hypothetical protein